MNIFERLKDASHSFVTIPAREPASYCRALAQRRHSGNVEDRPEPRILLDQRTNGVFEVGLAIEVDGHLQIWLKVVMHGLAISDEKELAQVRDAVTAMMSMDDALASVIGDIDVLSGRSAEQEALSTKMSATTDAIADNVKAYSTSVLETSASIEEMVLSIKETSSNIEALATSTEQSAMASQQASAIIAASLIYHAAMRDEKLPRKPHR